MLNPTKQFNYQDSAERAANRIYEECRLDIVVVAEAWWDENLEKVCYNLVYKRERTCKHPNLQLTFTEGMVCEECKLTLVSNTPEVISSKIEDIKKEEDMEVEEEEE